MSGWGSWGDDSKLYEIMIRVWDPICDPMMNPDAYLPGEKTAMFETNKTFEFIVESTSCSKAGKSGKSTGSKGSKSTTQGWAANWVSSPVAASHKTNTWGGKYGGRHLIDNVTSKDANLIELESELSKLLDRIRELRSVP